MRIIVNQQRLAIAAASFLFLFMAGSAVFAQKTEQISATAMGTMTQMGRVISIDIRISGYSTADDQQVLLQVFAEKGSEGVANALHKMPSKGRIAITGTLGFDLNYVRSFPMPDGGRRIRFVTDRPITFGELWSASRSMDYSLSMGEIIISKKKGENKGTLYPAAKFNIDKDGILELETMQNPWNLMNIRVWK
ncbi:MAG TPA: hypothetical protein PLL77_05560 [Pyrinomonadaceae bacterium]|nr:hypothetical protein [Pyrinomonadaceae bacterium]